MKHFILTIFIILSVLKIHAQVPENCGDVMLQGFYWESQRVTSWSQLNNVAQEIADNFDMVWLPPSSKGESYSGTGGSDNGYHPKIWSDQNSDWGSLQYLKTLIANLHANDCKVLADVVVNHRAGNTSWCNFAADNFGEYGSYQLTSSHICGDDEVNSDSGAGSCKGKATGQKDTGENWCCARDLDHTNSYVQEAIVAYLQWMKDEIGYDGWRYDMVKGFGAEYIAKYNEETNPYFSVGEYWDGSYMTVATWIDGTKNKSAAFDFPGKYNALNEGLAKKNYAKMASNNKPAGLISSNLYRRYAVTFVDNHDTYRDDSKYVGDVLQAYAYVLSAPGVPCVFWLHWTANKTDINEMIRVRKLMGIHSESDCIVKNTNGYYESETTGTKGKLICRIGEWSAATPEGYELACSGDGWAYYTQTKNTGIKDSGKTSKVIAYPNPVKDILHFDPADIKTVYLTTTGGAFYELSVKNGTIDLTSFPASVYFLQVITNDNVAVEIKIIKD